MRFPTHAFVQHAIWPRDECDQKVDDGGLIRLCGLRRDQHLPQGGNMPAIGTKGVIEGDECYRKAKEKGEPTFTLRAQDFTAPLVIIDWIREQVAQEIAPTGAARCSDEKLREAFERALEMRNWPHRKVAD